MILKKCKNLPQVSDVAHGPLVFFNYMHLYLKCIFILAVLFLLFRSLLESCQPFKTTIRTKIRYSKMNKEKTARPVIRRFFRLDWGAWIRTRTGRGKRRYQKSAERRRRLDQHVFCNKQQNKLLDQLVTPFWRRKMHFVDDPYAPYQKRHHISRFFKEKQPFYPWSLCDLPPFFSNFCSYLCVINKCWLLNYEWLCWCS